MQVCENVYNLLLHVCCLSFILFVITTGKNAVPAKKAKQVAKEESSSEEDSDDDDDEEEEEEVAKPVKNQKKAGMA